MGAFHHIPGLWLDVTRLLTRIGRGALTGIDRVELAYVKEAIRCGCTHFICRTTRGYLLLDQRGAVRLIAMADGSEPAGSADWLSTMTFRGNRPRHRAEAALRTLAVDRCSANAVPAMLDRHASPARTYLNVGHSNLMESSLAAFARAGQVAVLIHDLIPLSHPGYVAATQSENFAGRIDRVRRYATHIIANSAVTDAELTAHWHGKTAPQHRVVAHLGVEPNSSTGVPRDSRHFVMLGTIEPRKNHTLMLDAWELLAKELPAPDMPHLHIIGATGWNVAPLLARLNAHPLLGRAIFLHGALPDAAVRDHLARATALVFPSLAEGYGFPPLEAALAGATPICSNLPVFRETLGDCAVYVHNADAYHWKETIKKHYAGTTSMSDLCELKVPTWQEHFETVAEALTPRAGQARP